MRKFVLLLVLTVSGCSAFNGPARRRPGSNVVLPASSGLLESVAKGLACAAQTRDSSRTPATSGPQSPRTTVRTSCNDVLHGPLDAQPSQGIKRPPG